MSKADGAGRRDLRFAAIGASGEAICQTRLRARRADFELQPGEPGVDAALGDQRGVIALLDNPPRLHHQNAVSLQHRRQPMGDHQRRAPGHHVVERGLNLRFVVRVERRRRLVEQQDRRVLENGARDRQALPLPARQRDAALAKLGRVALVEIANEAVRGRAPGRRLDSRLARASRP